MKRVKVVALAKDSFDEKLIYDLGFIEIEKLEVKQIPKESDIFTEHSFDMLKDAAKDFVNSGWSMFKSFGKMSMWAIVSIAEAFRWLWNSAFKK